MMLRTFGGALAAAFCGAALLGAPAQAATVGQTAATVPAVASDCWYSHSYDGYWHHHARYVCDDDDYYDDGDYYGDDYGDYYPGYYYGGGGFHHGGHGGFGHGHFGHHGR